jgi:hypothetical protein
VALILLAVFTFVLIAGFVKTKSGTEFSTYLIEVVALFAPFLGFICGYYFGKNK